MDMYEAARSWRTWAVVSAVVLGFGVALSTPAQDWHEFVEERVALRNAALKAHDWEALAALTAPDSSARRGDEQLWQWLASSGAEVEDITTAVVSVDVVASSGPVLEVVTRQVDAQLSASGETELEGEISGENAAEALCGRWHFEEGLLRDVRPCPIKVRQD